jgi:hypothetical protein
LLAANNRVVTVLGIGGLGKTRLAAEIAVTAESAGFRDGVIWHEVADYTTLDTLTGLIRDHLRLGKEVSDDDVWRALDRRAVLLVLDNAESSRNPKQLADCLNRIDQMGGTRVLITSRIELTDLRGGKRHLLAAPSLEAAVKILEEMINAEPPHFPLNGQAEALATAAQSHPRLMQYAVCWLDTYPVEVVLDTLKTLKGADAGEALEDMILKTVNKLKEQPDGEAAIAALRKLAVCRGGFTYDAAKAILGTDSDPRLLAILQRWNLVQNREGRYEVDPLVTVAVGEDENAYSVHYDYYLELIETFSRKQQFFRLEPEFDNITVSFERSLERGFYDAIRILYVGGLFLNNRRGPRFFLKWLAEIDEPYPVDDDSKNDDQDLMSEIKQYHKDLIELNPHENPLACAKIYFKIGKSYYQFSDENDGKTNSDNLHHAVDAFASALSLLNSVSDAPMKALNRTYELLGDTYFELSEYENKSDSLHNSISAYKSALQYISSNTEPITCGNLYSQLGNSYAELAKIENLSANTQDALVAFNKALVYFTPETAPHDYADTLVDIGNVYDSLEQYMDAIMYWLKAETEFNRLGETTHNNRYVHTLHKMRNIIKRIHRIKLRIENLKPYKANKLSRL